MAGVFEKTWVRGTVAGIAAAISMALWFLVVDASRGVPLGTPSFISSALLGGGDATLEGPGLILFSVFHIAAFVTLGLAVSWALRLLRTAPTLPLGLIVGFLLFDIVFYLGVTITGVDVVAELGWPEVLGGDLIAGVTLMGSLHLMGATPQLGWGRVFANPRLVREAVLSGLIGAGVVAAWFLVFDVAAGRPFFTPGALGSALFFGARDISDITVSVATVSGYTIIHLAAFLIAGLVGAVLAWEAEKAPPLLIAGLLLFIAFEAFFFGLLALVAQFLLGPIAWWAIATGNLLAAAAMGGFLWSRHPELRAHLRDRPAGVEERIVRP